MEPEFTISTDKTKLDREMIFRFISEESYWGQNITREKVDRAIENSICFGVYLGNKQVGYARVITDQATMAYLSDVFILSDYRGRGLSKRLMETIQNWPTLQGLRRWLLFTQDAHGLYSQFGFTAPDRPEWIMQRKGF